MTKVVSAKCPECGARLKVDPQADQAKCDYCGAISPIQTKKQVKVAQAKGNQVQAIQVGNAISKFVVMMFLLPVIGTVLVGVITLVVSMSSISNSTSIGNSLGSIGERLQWHGDSRPILMDITGDRVPDPIGRVRKLNISTSAHTEHLGAFDALTGKHLWISAPLSDISQGHYLRVAGVGTTLLVADSVGVLRALEPVNGQVKWSATVGERVERICGSNPGLARIETTDDRAITAVLATGQLSPAGKADSNSPCYGAWSTAPKGGTPWVRKLGGAFFRGEPLPDIQGMSVEYVFREVATNASIAVGQKSQGTRIPMAAAYNPAVAMAKGREKSVHHFHKIETTATWLTNIPAVNPLTVYEDSPESGSIAMGRAIFPYRMMDSKNGWRLACLDAATGRNLWDVQIPNPDTDVGAIATSNQMIFVSAWTGLHVFDLANGAHRVTIAKK